MLLSLIPPSQTNTLPAMDLFNNTGVDFLKGQTPDNNDRVRDRKLSHSSNISRDNSMLSTASSRPYHEKMEQNNDMDVDNNNNILSELFYETSQEREIHLRTADESREDTLPSQGKLTNDNHFQHVPKKNPNSTHIRGSTAQNKESIFFNIPLLYDPDVPTDSKIWGSNFHLVSFHGSIEYLASDIKNIKDCLKFMTKYITNKKIDSSKANDLEDFKGIGEVVWNFISSVYKANWDVLSTDDNSTLLRRKIASKFIPRMQSTPQRANKENKGPFPASIERLPPPIPAKSPKEVNEISKFFKSNKMNNSASNKTKSYAQASKQNASMADIIKIKETFPSMDVKEIDQINNIIRELSKSKPCIQMTTKSPSRKQVIISMVKNNIDNFIKNSSIHMTNLNRNLRNAISEVLVNFIHSDPLGITVVTNKVSLNSNLLIIEKYIKILENIDSTQVESPRLLQSKSYLKIIDIPYYSHRSCNSQEHPLIK